MSSEVTIQPLREQIYLAERPMDGDAIVRAALLLGRRRSVVVDTLTSPEDMAPLLAIATQHGRPIVVVNTHADWDHVWGNAAFPGATIVGHQLCRARLLGDAERATLAQKRQEQPHRYAQVLLNPPDVTFATAMTLDLGGLTLELHHLPGHTEDCLVAYVPEQRLLLAGDCAEDPLPLLNSGPLDGWIHDLRAWAARDVDTVVPSHGAISDPALLRENAAYLERLLDNTAAPLQPDLPAFYVAAHARNQAIARRFANHV